MAEVSPKTFYSHIMPSCFKGCQEAEGTTAKLYTLTQKVSQQFYTICTKEKLRLVTHMGNK